MTPTLAVPLENLPNTGHSDAKGSLALDPLTTWGGKTSRRRVGGGRDMLRCSGDMLAGQPILGIKRGSMREVVSEPRHESKMGSTWLGKGGGRS